MRGCRIRIWLIFGWACLLSACSAPIVEVSVPNACHPLVGTACMLPWPSSFYLKADSSTVTGYRVAYPQAALPHNEQKEPLDPTPYNRLDGFTIGPQIVVQFPTGISPEGLPAYTDIAHSLSEESLVTLIEFGSGARVPLFAEPDLNVVDEEIPSLIVRPQVPLKFNTRYIVALRRGLTDTNGVEIESPSNFQLILRGQSPEGDALRAIAPSIEEVIARLDELGLARETLLLAWDFHTTSEEAVTGRLKGMISDARKHLEGDPPTYRLTKVTEQDPSLGPDTLRLIEGEFMVPSYLSSDAPDAGMQFDEAGKPLYRGLQAFPFYVAIPKCAEQHPVPLSVAILGHGLLAAPRLELLNEYHQQLRNRLCMIEAAIAFIGLSQQDATGLLSQLVGKFSLFSRVTDRLTQAHVNLHLFVDLIQRRLLDDEVFKVNARSIATSERMRYLGFSLGGIQGITFAALTNQIERFLLNVGGGWFSLMIQRSTRFNALDDWMTVFYPKTVDRLLLVSLTQSLFDYTDPLTFAHRVVREPLAGNLPKKVLLQEARYDTAIPNLATRGILRAMGLPLMLPKIETVYGVEEHAGPLESAYTQWDTNPPTLPATGNHAGKRPPEEEDPHSLQRRLEPAIQQIELFLKPEGKVVDTCNGPCLLNR